VTASSPWLPTGTESAVGTVPGDVSWIRSAQPHRFTGPLLPREAWSVLVAVLEEELPEAIEDELRLMVEHLVLAGLLTEDGQLTEDGLVIARTLADPLAVISVECRWDGGVLGDPVGGPSGRQDAGTGALAVFLSPTAAVTLGTPGPATCEVDPATGRGFALELFELEWAPVAVASWTGAGPGRPWTEEPPGLPLPLVEARAGDPATPPPPGVPDELAMAWAEPWVLWEIRTAPGEERMLVLRMGDREPLALSTPDGGDGVVMAPVAPYTLWRTLVALVRRALVAAVAERG